MITLTRRRDWPERLHAFIEARRSRPFCWGENDCALFAADAVLAMTDTDLADAHRGYTTDRAARKLIKAAGGIRGFVADLPAKKSAFAQRGDVVLVNVEGRETLGVVCGNGHWCAPGENGVIFRPMSEVDLVFGI